MKQKSNIKSAKKQKYDSFKKVDEKPTIKTFEVTKEQRTAAEKSYFQALRLTKFLKENQNKKTFKRFCKCCSLKTVFNRTKDDGIVCSICGTKEGGEFNPTFSTEKFGIKRFK